MQKGESGITWARMHGGALRLPFAFNRVPQHVAVHDAVCTFKEERGPGRRKLSLSRFICYRRAVECCAM